MVEKYYNDQKKNHHPITLSPHAERKEERNKQTNLNSKQQHGLFGH